MTFGTAGAEPPRARFPPMEAIATITAYAAIACLLALLGIIWRHAERADEGAEYDRETAILRRQADRTAAIR